MIKIDFQSIENVPLANRYKALIYLHWDACQESKRFNQHCELSVRIGDQGNIYHIGFRKEKINNFS